MPDPRVPEAAGLVSLRGRELYFLGLGNAILVDGVAEDDVLLAAGMRFSLAGVVNVEVTRVDLPARVLALRMPGEVRELCAPVHSFVPAPEFDLVPGFVGDAAGRVWSTGSENIRWR